MKDEQSERRSVDGRGLFYAPGITRAQIERLEMRARAERFIRQAMAMNGALPEEIDAFVTSNLPSAWDVVVKNSPRRDLHT